MIEAAGVPVVDPRGLTLPADLVSGIVLTFEAGPLTVGIRAGRV